MIERLLVTDIFGHSDSMQRLADALPGETRILQPYSHSVPHFSDEHQAYAWFCQHSDVEQYAQKVVHSLTCGPVKTLIGFSAGGAAVWLAASRAAPGLMQRAICFYPGQIRHFLQEQPQCPIQLLWPSYETYFDVTQVAAALSDRTHVSMTHTPYLHGFMNPQSAGFSQLGYRQFRHWLAAQ